ncbi:hypothetical protein CR513_28713, partial [Mucuna pruriens]
MTMILELLKDAFKYVNIPNSFYEAKKVINKLGLNYTKIDTFENIVKNLDGNQKVLMVKRNYLQRSYNLEMFTLAFTIDLLGSKKMLGNNVDVYLQPLTKELNELWTEGVESYDSSLKELFRILMKKHFDGTIEERDASKLLSGSEILKQLDDIIITFERNLELNLNGKRNSEEDEPKQWKKKSIFFNLPYWKDNILCNNFDVMHIKKNACDSVLYTLHKDDKSKNHLQAYQDLKVMGIKKYLRPNENGKCLPLLYTMA